MADTNSCWLSLANLLSGSEEIPGGVLLVSIETIFKRGVSLQRGPRKLIFLPRCYVGRSGFSKYRSPNWQRFPFGFPLTIQTRAPQQKINMNSRYFCKTNTPKKGNRALASSVFRPFRPSAFCFFLADPIAGVPRLDRRSVGAGRGLPPQRGAGAGGLWGGLRRFGGRGAPSEWVPFRPFLFLGWGGDFVY